MNYLKICKNAATLKKIKNVKNPNLKSNALSITIGREKQVGPVRNDQLTFGTMKSLKSSPVVGRRPIKPLEY